jgi:hypothetical protein
VSQATVEMRSRQRTLRPKDIAKDIMNGNSFDHVQQKYGIKMRSQLLELYTKGLEQLEEIPNLPVVKKIKAAAVKPVKTKARRTIGSSGTITLTKSLLIDEFGFRAGDEFSLSRQGNSIILTKVE